MDKIKNFNDISRLHKIDETTLEKINQRLADSMGIQPPEDVQFTSLQLQAFNTEGFWLSDNMDRHIIVQGATSSGKTLVSEMAILDTLKENNKCIVLVPLRAMVRERWDQLKKDLDFQGNERQIYASSADYQDHDGEIITGKYTVAVIVYEKFFNMLSQSNNKMLEECALLVVDELQMLSNVNRGPKLEIAIQKVLRSNELGNPYGIRNTRIMCLTTSDCRVNFIQKWLTTQKGQPTETPPILIVNPNRPTTLHEHVIQFNGEYKVHTTYGENDSKALNSGDEPGNGKIDIPNYNKNDKSETKKRNLLLQLLRNIYGENPRAKVLIFVNGRARTRDIAELVADNDILPIKELPPELMFINNFDDDDYQRLFKEKLFPHGIACHNAAISTALREYVERMFSSPSEPLKLVVATETLTIGMNMPVDVMILYDHEIPRSEGLQRISSQEYKNFVGRAGRLGQRNIHGGKSYIFASNNDEARFFWDMYVNCRADEIRSSLINALEEDQAPYYLSLINVNPRASTNYFRESYSPEDLKILWLESFSNACGGRLVDMNKLCKSLKRANLCSVTSEDYDEDDEDSDIRYRLTDFGKGMVPYAFSLDTCQKINRYLFNGGYKMKKGSWTFSGTGGLPDDVSDEDLRLNKYLLDILYVLCSTKEIRQMGQMALPDPANSPDRSRRAMDGVEDTLRKIIKKEKKYIPWKNSPLLKMVETDYVWIDENREKKSVMRAIVLWYWTNGARISQIKKETNFPYVPLVAGDIARFAETVSYQIESFYHCRGHYRGHSTFDNMKTNSLYKLSTRVNYGVPQNLVSIANCHIHGLDRKVILDIGKLHEELSDYYSSPLQMLRTPREEHLEKIREILPEEYRQQIIQVTDDSNTRESFELLLDAIKKDSQEFSKDECDALDKMYKARTVSEEEYLLEELEIVFQINDDSATFFKNIELDFPLSDYNFASIKYNDLSLFLILDVGSLDKKKVKDYRHQIDRCGGKCKIIFMTLESNKLFELKKQPDGKLTLSNGDGDILMEDIDLAMTLGTFSGLIAQSIKLEEANALFELLWDMRGTFDRPLNSFNSLLRNYLQESHVISESQLKPIRVLWDKRKTSALRDLMNALEENKIPYRELPWGESLEEEDLDEPTLIFLKWGTVQSHCSLDKFCKMLARNGYRHIYGIFEFSDEFSKWGGDPSAPCETLEHCESTKNFAVDIRKFRYLLEKWQSNKYLIGISYAHAKVMNAERKGVTLLRKFVETVQKLIPEASVFFDQNPSSSHQFYGKGARAATLEKYGQCKYFVILEDEY